ncbi:hypothetical protein AB0M22_35005 [Nocardia sp. NPDC051756]|uniref:hypothetical protein n=1 Tax=Nocardia sp. NPDC051756 TaxID=3154751 RepID=UPI00342702B8
MTPVSSSFTEYTPHPLAVGATRRPDAKVFRKKRFSVAAPSFAASRPICAASLSSSTRRIDRVVVMAAASAAGAVGGNSQAQMISSASQTSETMMLIFVASSSVPASKLESDTVWSNCARDSRDSSPVRKWSNVAPIAVAPSPCRYARIVALLAASISDSSAVRSALAAFQAAEISHMPLSSPSGQVAPAIQPSQRSSSGRYSPIPAHRPAPATIVALSFSARSSVIDAPPARPSTGLHDTAHG